MKNFLRRTKRGIKNHRHLIDSFGLLSWLSFQIQIRTRRGAALFGHRLHAKASRVPLSYRKGESDLEAFIQIFTHGEYDSLGPVPSDGVIIDCGANVGYSSAYFASKFPTARLVAIEPDPGNFEVLSKNLLAFGSRVKAINCAVWSHDCGLVFERSRFRDGLGWSVMVREASDTESAEVAGFGIRSLMRSNRISRINLLKVDIERAEIALFSDPNAREWISLCDQIAIELHDEECRRVFINAIEGEGFVTTQTKELTICQRPHKGTR